MSKDLEKIKSEDLAAQVQDANPANFAIEQEVAQLVGATVPAPTEPSADDARELGAQLLVFLLRALLPIRSALRTAVAAIYAHLDSRCTDYTPADYAPFQDPATVPPYDPMRPLTPRTLPNLLTALTAFSARKISNGGAVDTLPDGVTLARILCDSSIANTITELGDIDVSWDSPKSYGGEPISYTLKGLFPNLTKLVMKCKQSTRQIVGGRFIETYELPDLEESAPPFTDSSQSQGCYYFIAPALKHISREFSGYTPKFGHACKVIYMPSLVSWDGANHTTIGMCDCADLWRVVLGKWNSSNTVYTLLNCPKVVDLEFAAGVAANLNFPSWNPSYVLSDNPTGNDLVTDEGISTNLDQFLQNFREHIAERLQGGYPIGQGPTLTLSQAVRNAIHAAESTYGIENIIVTQKGWTISPAPGASSQ